MYQCAPNMSSHGLMMVSIVHNFCHQGLDSPVGIIHIIFHITLFGLILIASVNK